MNYLELRDEIKEGDVIVFSLNTPLGGLIKLFTSSNYTHVGIVIKADMGVGLGDRLMLVESTFSLPLPGHQAAPDALTREIRSGVQMQWLSRRVEAALLSGEKLWLLTLKQALNDTQLYEMKKWLSEQHFLQTRYDFAQPLGAALDIVDKLGMSTDPNLGSLFCSELVAIALYKVGLFDGNPSEQVPSDIVRLGCFSELIPITMPEIESASPASPGQRRAKGALATTGFMPVKFKAPKFE